MVKIKNNIEARILKMLLKAYTVNKIVETLKIPKDTVNWHISKIYKRLGIQKKDKRKYNYRVLLNLYFTKEFKK